MCEEEESKKEGGIEKFQTETLRHDVGRDRVSQPGPSFLVVRQTVEPV